MSEPLDHHGPIDGMCFLGLNFTPEQFDAISSAIVDHMDQSGEFAVESGIVAIVTGATRQKAIIDGLVAEVARLRGVIEEAIGDLIGGKYDDVRRDLIATMEGRS